MQGKKTQTLYRGTVPVKAREKNPPAKLRWTSGVETLQLGTSFHLGWHPGKGVRDGSASDLALQPYSTKGNLRAIFQLTGKRWPASSPPQRPPASRQALPVAFLPSKLLVEAELIWSQWELSSSFIQEAQPGAQGRGTQRLLGRG